MINGAQSVYRTVNILESVYLAKNGISAKEISQYLSLPLSTTHRILAVLCERSFIRQDNQSHKYYCSHIHTFDNSIDKRQLLYNRYADIPHFIVNEFGCTSYLYCRIGYSYLCLSRAEGQGAVQVFSSFQGELRYLGDGAGSFSILGSLPPDERQTILKANLPFFRSRLLRSESDLFAAIEEAAVKGYGSGHDFRVAGTGSLSMPIIHNKEVLGAIAVSGVYDDNWVGLLDAMRERMTQYLKQRQEED